MYLLPDPRIRGEPATKAGSRTLVTLPGLEVPDATESYCEVLLYFPAWKWRVTRPGSCYEKRTSLVFSVPQRSRTGFLNWNYPSWAGRCPKGCMTSAAICVLISTLVAASCIHTQSSGPGLKSS